MGVPNILTRLRSACVPDIALVAVVRFRVIPNNGRLAKVRSSHPRSQCWTTVRKVCSSKVLDTLDSLGIVISDFNANVFALQLRFKWRADDFPEGHSGDISSCMDGRSHDPCWQRVSLLEGEDVFLAVLIRSRLQRWSEFGNDLRS